MYASRTVMLCLMCHLFISVTYVCSVAMRLMCIVSKCPQNVSLFCRYHVSTPVFLGVMVYQIRGDKVHLIKGETFHRSFRGVGPHHGLRCVGWRPVAWCVPAVRETPHCIGRLLFFGLLFSLSPWPSVK